MKHQHKQPEVQSPLAFGEILPDLAGHPVDAAKDTEFLQETQCLTAGAPHPTPVVTLAAPEGSAWWEEDEPVTRTGGVCLLIA